jgi:hypothetical protein
MKNVPQFTPSERRAEFIRYIDAKGVARSTVRHFATRGTLKTKDQ